MTDIYTPMFPLHFLGINARRDLPYVRDRGDEDGMKLCRRLRRDEHGAAAIEMAFALPILIVMIWMFVQLAQVYRAIAGIQQALGEGARYATLCLNPTRPAAARIPPERAIRRPLARSRRRSKPASTASGRAPSPLPIPSSRHVGTGQLL